MQRSIGRLCAATASASTASTSASPLPLPKTPFEALGLAPPQSSRQYSATDIKAAYKKTALRVHPDVAGGSQRHFVLAQAALKLLETSPNDTTSWVGSSDFPGSVPKPPASAQSQAAAGARPKGSNRRPAYATKPRNPAQTAAADAWDASRTANPTRSGRARSPGYDPNAEDFWGHDTDINGDANPYRGAAWSPHVPNAQHDPQSSSYSGSGAPRPNTYVKRHWINQAACYYYAAAEGRLGTFMKEEAQRRQSARAEESDVKRRFASAAANAASSPEVCMIWGVQKPIFGNGLANIVEFMAMINVGIGAVLGWGGVVLYFYCSYGYWQLPM